MIAVSSMTENMQVQLEENSVTGKLGRFGW